MTVYCKVTRRICLISDEMFASQSATKVLLGLNKETIFIIALEKMHILVENWNDVIIALEKMHILVENRKWVVWEAKDRLCIFGINIPSWLSKTMQRVCNLVFHILWELRVQILKNHENKAKRPTFVSMSLIWCPISNGMFPSQSAPKVLLEPNKDIRFIME